MRDQLVTETIDARILRLVGLEDVFDLDYDTYLVLLREAQVKGKNKIPAEEQALLANERKRVRGKTGRFKTKSKKIRVENITSVQSMGRKLLPGTRALATTSPFAKSLVAISKTVESISENLSDQSKAESKEAEDNRKEEENKRRRQREESLESGVKKVAAAAKKLFAPVKGIFDAIFNYIYYTFLGKGLSSALDWLANPENKSKIDAVGKFIKDFWPALLGTAAFFFTPLGRFIKTAVSVATRIIKFLRPFKAGAVSPAGMAVGTAISTFEAERRRQAEEERLKKREAEERGVSEETVSKERREAKKGIWSLFGDAFSQIGPGYMGIAGGGFVDQNTGLQITGAGPDTQLTALQPGEVVMNRAAVKAIGVDKLLRLNSIFGGPNANKPRFANNIQLAQGGGLIGSIREFLSRGTGKVMTPMGSELGFQRKFLGMNIGSPERIPLTRTYRDEDVERYNALREKGGKPDRLVKDMFGRHFSYTPPTPTTRPQPVEPKPKQKGFVQTFVDAVEKGYLGKGKGGRVEQIEEILGRPLGEIRQDEYQQYMMEKYGRSTVGEQRRLLLGPQSRSLPSITPSNKKPNIITLPPSVEMASSDQPLQVAGSDVPSFSAIAPSNRRMENAQIYGIVG